MNKTEKKLNIKLLVTISILVALHVILSRFFSINAWNIRIGFAFIPIFVAAYLHGTLAAGTVAGIADVLGAILFPSGPFFPGFTLTSILTGIIYGVLLNKQQTKLRIAVAVLLDALICTIALNSLWITLLYDTPYLALVSTRVIQSAVTMPVEFVVIWQMSHVLKKMKNM